MDQKVSLGPPGLSLEVGDHVCALYRGPRGRDEVLLPYIQAGLEARDRCVVVLDQADPREVATELAARGDYDVEEALATRQLDIQGSADTYLRDGTFRKDEMLAFWEESFEASSRTNEYALTRACGEMTWALQDRPGVEDLLAYEAELNLLLPRYPQVAICFYALDQFDGDVVVELLRTHPKLLMCGTVVDNPYYQEPSSYLADRTVRT